MKVVNDEGASIDDLRALPPAPLPAAFAARVHARARAAFERAERPPARFAGPALAAALATATAVYLTWAVDFLNGLR